MILANSWSVLQEESYLHFAASALAGIGLVRNLFGFAFPLFGRQMYGSRCTSSQTTTDCIL